LPARGGPLEAALSAQDEILHQNLALHSRASHFEHLPQFVRV
jgi:hypothetical protein